MAVATRAQANRRADRSHRHAPAAASPPLPAWQQRVLDLQRTAGNGAVTSLVVQRRSAGGPPRPTLRRGSAGRSVQALQEALNTSGVAAPPLATDGDFGPATDRAVRAHQTAKGLGADGVVGPRTWASLGGGSAVAAPQGAGGASPQVAAVGAKLAQIKALLDGAAPTVKRMSANATTVDEDVAAVVRPAPAPAHDLFDDAADWLGETAGEVVDAVAGGASEVAETVSNAGSAVGEWVGETAGEVVDTVTGAVGDAGAWLGEKVGGVVDTVGGAAAALGDAAGGAVGGAVDWVTETGSEVITGLQDAAGDVAGSLESLGAKVVVAFQDEWQKLKDIAGAIASGLGLDTILGWLDDVWNGLKKKVDGLLGGAEDQGEGGDIHGTLPGVRMEGIATACDLTEGFIAYSSKSGRGPVDYEGKDLGKNQPTILVDGTYTIYRGRDGVRIDGKVMLENTWDVRGSKDLTPITDADDPAIGPSTWDLIANDLDPALGTGYPHASPRAKYWVESFTVDHEQFHEKEILDLVAKEVKSKDVTSLLDRRYIEVSDWWRFQRWLGMDPGEETKVKKMMNGFLDDIGKHMKKAIEDGVTGFQAEARAYRAGRPSYEKLVSAIRARGLKNKWPRNVAP